MAIITIDKISLAFGHHILLDKVNFGIEKNDKIGLIGRNGTGKSSLLKAIAGAISLDDGQIHFTSGTKVVYVAQEPQLNPEHTIFEEILSGLGEIRDCLSEYYRVLDMLADNHTDELSERLSQLQDTLDHQNGWLIQTAIDKVISELGLNEHQKIKDLSGGLKKKVALAKALAASPDVLLLDEPTNHLDIYAVEWLEKVINDFKGTVVLVTHDRVFLDKTVNRILELDRGRINSYPGNYSKYKELKAQQLADEEKTNREFDKFLAQEEVWIRKGIEARRTRNEGRVKRLKELRVMHANRREQLGKAGLAVDSGNLSGKIVTELTDINLKFDDKIIIKDFSTTIMRGDKIGLIGVNGAGKSTLLKIILGQLAPDSGKVKLGTKLEVAYFDQLREQLNDEDTIQDVVSQGQDFVEVGGRKLHIATYLQEFLFEPARFRSPIKSLSGGERNRLLLARLFSKPANVLVLDEPTNDLDIETLELLEELLVNYEGTVFLVSHDREFLDNVVTESYVFLGEGQILEFVGGYSDWIQYKEKYLNNAKANPPPISAANSNTVKANTTTGSATTANNDSASNNHQAEIQNLQKERNKLSYKERLELEQLPQILAQLEQEQAELQNKLLDPELYRKEPQKAQEYQLRINAIETELLEKMARWEELERRNK